MSALLGQLLGYYLDNRHEEQNAVKRQEALKRAEALLGYSGASPTDREVNSFLHGGGPDYSTFTPEQAKQEVERQQKLVDAMDANAPAVEQFRLQSAMQEAANRGGGPSFQDFMQGFIRAKLPSIMSQLSTRQQADVANNKALGDPYMLQGGVMGNTETGHISDYSPAVGALSQLRQRQAESEANRQGMLDAQAKKYLEDANYSAERAGSEENRRALMNARSGQSAATAGLNQAKSREILGRELALDQFFNTRDPRYLERATGKPATGTGNTITLTVEGKPQVFRVEVDASGKTRYVPVMTDEGKPMGPADAKGRGPSTLERNNEFIRNVTGATPQEALGIQFDRINPTSKLNNLLKRQQQNQAAPSAQAFRSPADILAAYKAGKISRTEAETAYRSLNR